MFDIFFGWRKASKCKKLIKRVRCRLKLLKNKRYTIVKQLREDMAQLIKLGYEETAFNRAEQLFKDESIMAVYEMLDHFSEFVNIQLSYIRRHKDCPNDINEAVSSLIFASARCADLPELPAIRKLFGERYGQRFATAAVELHPGNLVNRKIKEKLSVKSVSDDDKYRLIDEIARDHCLQPEILALEYFPEKQLQVKEIDGHQELERNGSTKTERSQMQTSDANEIAGQSIQVYPLASQYQSCSHPNSDALCTSLSCPSQRPSPDKIGSIPRMDSPFQSTDNTTLKHKDQRIKEPSSSESLPQFSEEVVVYLDDIEELHSSVAKGDCQDQRLFKFKSPVLPKREAVVDGNGGCKSSNAIGKRSRRKSLSLESNSLSMKDIDHEVYYKKPCKSSPNHNHKSHQHRKLQKRQNQPCCHIALMEGNVRPNDFKYNNTRKTYSCNCRFNSEVKTCCSLESPCYFCTSNNDRENQFHDPRNQTTGLRYSGQFSSFQCCSNGDLNWNLGRRSYDNGASVYEVFTMHEMQKEKTKGEVKGSDSQKRNETVPPYLRAMTMPQERPREVDRYSNILRSNSMPFQNPNHVHPKLPEYDDIEAKFRALKKEHLLHKL